MQEKTIHPEDINLILTLLILTATGQLVGRGIVDVITYVRTASSIHLKYGLTAIGVGFLGLILLLILID